MSSIDLSSEYLGRQQYEDVLSHQNLLSSQIRGTHKIKIFGMEFDPVITLGIRGDLNQDIFPGRAAEIPVFKTDRGGQATLHTPGQLVIYPMMDIKAYGIGVRDFVCVITKATSRVLNFYGIETFSGEAPGLYTQAGKIAFLGIRTDNGVIRHGLALNVFNDISFFSNIKSCGVMAAKIDKMQNYSSLGERTLSQLFTQWTEAFKHELSLSRGAIATDCNLQFQQ